MASPTSPALVREARGNQAIHRYTVIEIQKTIGLLLHQMGYLTILFMGCLPEEYGSLFIVFPKLRIHVLPARELCSKSVITNPLFELRSLRPAPRHELCSFIVYEITASPPSSSSAPPPHRSTSSPNTEIPSWLHQLTSSSTAPFLSSSQRRLPSARLNTKPWGPNPNVAARVAVVQLARTGQTT
ncbi:hypothetical protein LguiB_035576 [Lonicera macranthoides]